MRVSAYEGVTIRLYLYLYISDHIYIYVCIRVNICYMRYINNNTFDILIEIYDKDVKAYKSDQVPICLS